MPPHDTCLKMISASRGSFGAIPRGRGGSGTSRIGNGNILHNKSVPTSAAVFDSPKPSIVPNRLQVSRAAIPKLQEITATNQRPVGNNNEH